MLLLLRVHSARSKLLQTNKNAESIDKKDRVNKVVFALLVQRPDLERVFVLRSIFMVSPNELVQVVQLLRSVAGEVWLVARCLAVPALFAEKSWRMMLQ